MSSPRHNALVALVHMFTDLPPGAGEPARPHGVTAVRATHQNRQARFDAGPPKHLPAVYGITTFAGRLDGMRSARMRRRLPAESGPCANNGHDAHDGRRPDSDR
ncbi:hypothetical protein ABZ897_61145 [Nonomuraea sp. NPDC046802]|uniref:hypothetical protein n=1 Tax=Nonomuraea sp. NPDC046802 TaxID=3154919 RepID=UPI0033F17350